MILTGKELLENLELQKSLIKFKKRVLRVVWRDGSITNGIKKNICLEYIESQDRDKQLVYITDGFCSREVVPSMILTVEGIDKDIEVVYSVVKAGMIWGIETSVIYKAISTRTLKKDKDYRMVGRMILITEKAMFRVFGEPIINNK